MLKEANKIGTKNKLNDDVQAPIFSDIQAPGKSKILILDDDETSLLMIANMISQFGNAHMLSSSENAINHCLEYEPDIIILDVNMPKINGLDLCKEIKKHHKLKDIPVMFITGCINHETQKKCWEAGGVDFITKPILAMTLKHRVKIILENHLRMKILRNISFEDNLTGLKNRHYLNTEVKPIFNGDNKNKTDGIGVIVIDVDHFKKYNDTYGHIQGDECLKIIAETLKNSLLRPEDVAIRFGGEEFVVVLPNSTKEGVKVVSERISNKISALNLEHSSSEDKKVTISAGYSFSDLATDINSLICLADKALYEAKKSGRNTYRGSA